MTSQIGERENICATESSDFVNRDHSERDVFFFCETICIKLRLWGFIEEFV